jgi:hypothetical protein
MAAGPASLDVKGEQASSVETVNVVVVSIHSNLPNYDYHLISSPRVGAAFLADPKFTNVTEHFGESAPWSFALVREPTFMFIYTFHSYP